MKEPLKVGDRVKLRGFDNGGSLADGKLGNVKYIHDGLVHVITGSELSKYVHVITVSQCIRLVPKKRREIWAYEHPEQGLWLTCTPEKKHQTSRVEQSGGKVIRFVEAKEK